MSSRVPYSTVYTKNLDTFFAASNTSNLFNNFDINSKMNLIMDYWKGFCFALGNIKSIRLYKMRKLKSNMPLLRRCWSQFFQFWYPWNNRIFSADWYFLRKYFSKAVLLFEKPGYHKSNNYFFANDVNTNKADSISIYRSTAAINYKHNFGQPFLTCGVSDHYLL